MHLILAKFLRYSSGLLLLLISLCQVQAQNITRFEYFFDTDPGMGLATQVSVTPTDLVTNLSIPISTGALTTGIHTLYIRSENASNQWTSAVYRSIYVFPAPSVNNIVQVEYFIDTDPGMGLATTALGLTAATALTNFPIDITALSLSVGIHTLYVRAKTADGNWTEADYHPFNVVTTTPPPTISSFSPTSGFPGVSVTISGTNFDPVAINNTVKFNGSNATVTAASSTSLTVTLPNGATSGNISVTVGGLTAFSSSSFSLNQTQVVAAEYFFDTDPGQGSGSPVTGLTPGTTVDISNFNVLTTSLSVGFHVLCVRTKDSNNVWGLYESRSIYVRAVTTAAPPPLSITAMEYFYDNVTDPGTGQSISITTGASVNVSSIALPNALSNGWHSIHVRTKDQNDVWGLYETRSIFVRPVTAVAPPASPITSIEYFIDNITDPGTGTFISVTTGTTVDIPNNLIPNSLALGWHNITVRAKNQDNTWGLYESRSVFVRPSTAVVQAPSPIAAMEYFVDIVTDPGSGTSISLTTGLNVDIPSTALTGQAQGWHTIHVRGKDQNNNWGVYETRLIFVYSSTASVPPPLAPIVSFEYFVDTDPGVGLSSLNFSQTPSTLITLPTQLLNVGSLPLGPHTIGLRAEDQNGVWSGTEQVSITIAPPCGLSPPPTINNVVRCDPGTLDLTPSGATGPQIYRWYTDPTTLTVLFTGPVFTTPVLTNNTNYYVTIYDPTTYCESTRVLVTAGVSGIPKPTLNLTGSLTVCAGNSVTLTAPNGFSQYNWSNGLTTQSITVSTTGTYSVTVGNGICLSPVSDGFTYNINPLPSKPIINATGGGSLCGTGSVTLTATAGLSTYSWSSGQSTQSIVVNAVGNFTVTGTDANGCQSVQSDVFIVSTSVPAKPVVTVTGNTSLCGGSTVDLIAPAGFSGYLWSNGVSASQITVSAAGNYSVVVSNGTCTSPASDDIVVTSVAIPSKPVITVTGNTTLCSGGFAVLSAPAGFSTYAWSDGENTRQIVISAGGSFSVQVGNAGNCMSVASDVTNITFTGSACAGPVSTPAVVSATRCGTGTVTLTATGATGSQVYRWYDLPVGGTLLSVGPSYVTPSISSTTSYYATIYDSSLPAESNPAVATATVDNLATPSINPGGPLSLCAGSSTLLSAPLGFTNYVWSNGANTQQISVSAAGSYSVQTGDGTCVSISSATVVVSISPALSKPTITATGSLPFCGSGTVQLSTPAGLQYQWSTGAASNQITVSTPGNYSVTVSNGVCTSPVSDDFIVNTVTIPAKPVVTNTGPTALCNNAIVALTAPASGFYLWSTGETSRQIIASTAGDYTVQVGNAANCLSVASDPVTVTLTGLPCNTTVAPPLPPIVSNGIRCGSGTIVLSASGAIVNEEFHWFTASSGGSPVFIGPAFTTPSLTSSGTFYVSKYNTINGAESSRVIVTATVTNIAKPALSQTGTNSVCAGSPFILSAPTGFLQYLWSNGATTQQINVTVTGNYTVQVGDGNCLSVASDVTTVSVVPAPSKPSVTITGNTTFCQTGSVTLTGPAGFQYLWSNGATTISVTITDNAVISLVIKNSTGCSSPSSDPVVITKQGPPCQPNFPPVITPLPIGAKIEGIATADLTKMVSDPNDNLDFSSLHFLTNVTAVGAQATIDGNYIMSVDYKGLPFSGEDRITLSVCDLLGLCVQKILTIGVSGELVVYNGITPDGDGKNDFFYLQYLDVIPNAQKNKVSIFNRWGDVIFEVTDYNNKDRVFTGIDKHGSELPGGSYFYRIDIEDGKPITGYITLKR